MNLNDFNRYAEDFEEKKGGLEHGRFVMPASPLPLSMTDRSLALSQMANQVQQMAQQQPAVNSTAVASLSSIGFNKLGEIISLRNR